MSQVKVLKLLDALGGCAKASDIIKEAKRQYPKDGLHRLVPMRLTDLRKNELVMYEPEDQQWSITQQGRRLLDVLQAQEQKVRK